MATRRSVLKGVAATAAAGIAIPAQAASTSGGKSDQRMPLDFSKPEDNLYGFLKLFGDFSGKRTFFYQPGRIFAHRGGELPLHLLNYSGVTCNEVRRINAGLYITRYIGWMLMRDPITDAIIDEWVDPWSGETKKIRHFTTEGGKRTHHVNGLEYPPGLSGVYNRMNKPFILPWQIVGDDAWAPNDIFSVYTDSRGNKRYENAIHTYHGKLSDLENRELTNAPSTIASQSQSPYFPWMGGLTLKGHMILTSLGRKHTRIDEIPASVLEGIERRYPGQLDTVFPWEDNEVAS